MLQELRYAFRSLGKARGFTTAAIVTLALGIGATTAVFSIVNGLLLRPLPFGGASARIVSLHSSHATMVTDRDDSGVSLADFRDVRDESRLLEDAGIYFSRSFTLYGDEAVRVPGGSVSPNLFALLDVEPALGRGFEPGEGAEPGFESVVLLSDALWQSRFGADPDIVGTPIVVNERELVVIGVLPARFRFPDRDLMWVPFTPKVERNRAIRSFLGVGRLRPGVTLTESRLELESLSERLEDRYPETNRGFAIYPVPFREYLVDQGLRTVTLSLLAAVGLVLLVGCANLASLLLARGAARQSELAVRSALGAGRARLARHTLLESLILAAAGGALGVLLSVWALDALVASFPEELPYWLHFTLDARVLAFTGGLTLLTSVAFGLVPALSISRVDLTASLAGGRDPRASRSSARLQNALVVGQVALSLSLLVGAALLYQSFLKLTTTDPGFDESNLLTLRVYLAGDAYDPLSAKVGFFQQASERLTALPGVVAAAATTSIPSDDGGWPTRLVTPEHPVPDGSEIGVQVVGVTPRLFEALDLELVEGRPFGPGDLAPEAPGVAIVNEALARKLALTGGVENQEIGIVNDVETEWLRVVGVAPNVHYEEFGEETEQSSLNVYVPYPRTPSRNMAFLVRTVGAPASAAEPVRRALSSMAPGVPIYLVRTMEEVRQVTNWEAGVFARLFNAFAVAAVLLACLGIYGLTSYRIGQMAHEIGVRVALGADFQSLVALLVSGSVLLCLTGLGIGVVVSAAMSQALASLLYGVESFSPLTYAGAAAVLLGGVLLASYFPARRAAATPPMSALRQE